MNARFAGRGHEKYQQKYQQFPECRDSATHQLGRASIQS
ncbi:MAG: hypothetical protein OJF60_002524 [Burkholderiaceae bacterium]|nr:MAG: hypothetical protein OJF60_002524 [Burkholderiaceae bacterium]